MSQEQYELTEGEPQHLTIEGWKLYALIAVCLFAFSTISYNAMSARTEANQANTQITQQKASTGAKIDALMKQRTENRKQWSEEQKQIDSSIVKQAQLNASTDNIEEELAKLNISVIK